MSTPAPAPDETNVSVATADPYNNGAASDSYSVNASTDPLAAAAGVLSSPNAPGDFEFADSVADSLRSDAVDAVQSDLYESVTSGTYSPNTFATLENMTPDQLVEFSEFYESDAQTWAQFQQEPGIQPEFDVSHVPDIGTDPVGADTLDNAYANSPDAHFENDHLGNYNNDPGDYADPNADVDTAADAEFGEGANMHIVDESADLGLTGDEAIEGGEILGEGVEAATVTVEAAEGFEAADLLVLLILL